MARYTGAVCRLCRRNEEKLFLKGPRCNTPKCGLAKRAYAPGQHGEGKRSKLSNYGVQLRQKQKVKWMYGVLEKQFRSYFEKAAATKGVTGTILLQLLERRLDNVIFRSGVAISRAQARQIVRHNFVFVNNHRVNIPSFLIKKNDVIEIRAKEQAMKKIRDNLELSKDKTTTSWLAFDAKAVKATVLRLPERQDSDSSIQEQLIVELYSK